MYQAKITRTHTGEPGDIGDAMHVSKVIGGPFNTEEVDAEQGIWLICLNPYNEARLERDGFFAVSVFGITVEIEMP
jgi:hypothetical protein